MSTKSIAIIVGVTAAILSIPFIAMFFSDEVNWEVADFLIAAILLLGTGLLISWALARIKDRKTRIAVVVSLVILLALTWAELAVGLFGSPIAGS